MNIKKMMILCLASIGCGEGNAVYFDGLKEVKYHEGRGYACYCKCHESGDIAIYKHC